LRDALPVAADSNLLFLSIPIPQQKLKRRDYESVDELADDVDLIFSNALVFNMDESQMCAVPFIHLPAGMTSPD